MTWTRAKNNRLNFLRAITTPLSPEDLGKFKKIDLLLEAVLKDTLDREEALGEIEKIRSTLPDHADLRLHFMKDTEAKEKVLIEAQALAYEMDCEFASSENQRVLKDPVFLKACQKAEILPTRRQASKFRLGRRGLALRAIGAIG